MGEIFDDYDTTFKYTNNLPQSLLKILAKIKGEIDSNTIKTTSVRHFYIQQKDKLNHTSYNLYKRYYSKCSAIERSQPIRQYVKHIGVKKSIPYIDLMRELRDMFNTQWIEKRLSSIYPEDGGFLGWHTNLKDGGYRLYLNRVSEDDKSAFKYIDPDTKEMVTSYDKIGWQARIFKISEKRPLWHCVYAETPRVSLGFRITKMG